MGYEIVRPPLLGTYPSIESSRPMRWSAFEECGVRQVNDLKKHGEQKEGHKKGRKERTNEPTNQRAKEVWQEGRNSTRKKVLPPALCSMPFER